MRAGLGRELHVCVEVRSNERAGVPLSGQGGQLGGVRAREKARSAPPRRTAGFRNLGRASEPDPAWAPPARHFSSALLASEGDTLPRPSPSGG